MITNDCYGGDNNNNIVHCQWDNYQISQWKVSKREERGQKKQRGVTTKKMERGRRKDWYTKEYDEKKERISNVVVMAHIFGLGCGS